MSFGAALKEHLATYKRNTLGVDEDGTWQGRSYSHILPESHQHLNLLESIRGDCLNYLEEAGIKLHGGRVGVSPRPANLFPSSPPTKGDRIA